MTNENSLYAGLDIGEDFYETKLCATGTLTVMSEKADLSS